MAELSQESKALLSALDLKEVCESERYKRLAKLEAYGTGRQYAGCKYNWDGDVEYSDAVIAPGYYVRHKQRRPSYRVGMTQTCVAKLTDFAIAEDRLPEISVPGDQEAETFVRSMATEAYAVQSLIESRGYGGVAGAVMLSFAFVDGTPCIEVHKSIELTVLKWGDLRLGKDPNCVLKVRKFTRKVGKDQKEFWYLRYWSATEEAIAEVPCEGYNAQTWMLTTQWVVVEHGCGDCPCVWIQNGKDEDPDGCPDLSDDSRENSENLDRLLSATLKGTIANVDPTLVIHMDPATNPGTVRKGSDNAIFSQQGAQYLELSGTAVEAGLTKAKAIAKTVLDQAGVVLPDQERLTANASSGEALKLLYKPMMARCDKLRTQYGQHGLQRLLVAMLRAAKKLGGGVVLPPKLVTTRGKNGEVLSVTEKPVTPGTSERVTVTWPPYFTPTASDAAAVVNAALLARNKLISPKTAIQAVQNLGIFQIKDPEQEYADILAAREMEMELLGLEDEPGATGDGPPAKDSGGEEE